MACEASTALTTMRVLGAAVTSYMHLPLCTYSQDDVAGCFDYYAGLAEKLDERQYTPIDVGMDDFQVKVSQ
jgi:hypothetical protein